MDQYGAKIFTLAARNDYGRDRKTVLISYGATWIRNLKEMVLQFTTYIPHSYPTTADCSSGLDSTHPQGMSNNFAEP
ncbi:MAG: hypothetical protein IK079_04900 [Desulfovibrio sp.]|nr:hypothetical protein [Desulfovibrio sp.]